MRLKLSSSQNAKPTIDAPWLSVMLLSIGASVSW